MLKLKSVFTASSFTRKERHTNGWFAAYFEISFMSMGMIMLRINETEKALQPKLWVSGKMI